jgi:DNA repair exonuclease SbcCD nuclease subunit
MSLLILAGVIVSGDIAYGGHKSEYILAREHLVELSNDLKRRLNQHDVKFVFVPGNHDCDFSTQSSIRSLTIDAIRKGTVPDKDMIESCCKPQSEFVAFQHDFPGGKPDLQISPLHWVYRIENNGTCCEFRCYNTAWMSVLKEVQGTLHVPELEFDPATISSPAEYVVSVFHHPYNWMPSATFRRFKGQVEESSDLILTGHEHEPDHYQKYSFKSGEANDYLEGAVFQEGELEDRSGFHAVIIGSSLFSVGRRDKSEE